MTREEIATFPYSAMVELTKDSARLDIEMKKLGYDVTNSTFPDDDGTEYNGRFKRALLKVYKTEVVNRQELFEKFMKICLEQKRKRQNKKQFVAVITITDEDAFQKATRCNPTINGNRLIVDALNRELDWNELSGVKVEVLRSISETELKEIKT